MVFGIWCSVRCELIEEIEGRKWVRNGVSETVTDENEGKSETEKKGERRETEREKSNEKEWRERMLWKNSINLRKEMKNEKKKERGDNGERWNRMVWGVKIRVLWQEQKSINIVE